MAKKKGMESVTSSMQYKHCSIAPFEASDQYPFKGATKRHSDDSGFRAVANELFVRLADRRRGEVGR